MEEVGWSQPGVWRSERDHFINDDIMLGITDIYVLFNYFCGSVTHMHKRIFHSKDDRDMHFTASWYIKGSVH